MKKIHFNKEKNIGKVLLIVEGLKTEFYLLHKIFTRIFDFQYEKLDRMKKYRRYNKKEGIPSSVFVINTEESAITHIEDDNSFLNNMFEKLIKDYRFPIDRSSIFYIFDRDVKSNTDTQYIEKLIYSLSNSRDNSNKDFSRQGLFLLSYPAIESFVASNFLPNPFQLEFEIGEDLKKYLDEQKINQSRISEDSIKTAVEEMERAFCEIGITKYDLDDFTETNLQIFNFQEKFHYEKNKYKLLSLLSIVLLDLGMVQIEEDENTT